MAEIIVSPDVIDGIRAYLAALNPDADVSAGSLPDKLPARSINVTRTGGYRRDLVTDIAQISIDCRDASGETAADALAALVDGQLYAGVAGGRIGSLIVYTLTTLAGPYENPDPSHPSIPRSSANYQLAVRMHAQ